MIEDAVTSIVGRRRRWGLRPLRPGRRSSLDDFADRKALARYAEDEARGDVAALLRGK
jgi:hypothetical protein